MTKDNFPEDFIRGISNKDFIQDGYVLASAFQFDYHGREDNMSEVSINWLDDEKAIELALNQRKENGNIQFPAGVAKLNLSTVKFFLKNISAHTFSYERNELPDNPFHGNLLLKNDVTKLVKQLVTNGLALAAGTNIITNNKE